MTDLLDLMETAAEQTTLAEPASEAPVQMTSEQRYEGLIQKFTAEREEVINRLKDAGELLKTRMGEVATLDAAIGRAKDRQRLLSGSRGEYITAKAQAAASAFLGEPVSPEALRTENQAATDSLTLGEIQDGLQVLNSRRAEAERLVVFSRSEARNLMLEFYKLTAKISACRYELAKAGLVQEWVNLTACQNACSELVPGLSISITGLNWNTLALPNGVEGTELKDCWRNPHFSGASDVTASTLAGTRAIERAVAEMKSIAGVN